MRSATSIGCQTPTDQYSLCSRGLLLSLHFPDLHSVLSIFVVQSLSYVSLFAAPWTAAHQTSLSLTISQSLLKLMSIGHPTFSSSVAPFSSCPQAFPASGSFPMSRLFTSGGQNVGACPSYKRLSHIPC